MDSRPFSSLFWRVGDTLKNSPHRFTGVHALPVFPSQEDQKSTLDPMRRFSAATRYAHNRLPEGWAREELKLCGLFRFNARYASMHFG